MKPKSLKFKFTLYVGLLVVLLSLGISLISYFSASSAIKQEVAATLPAKADDVSKLVRARLDNIQTELEAIATRPEIKTMDWQTVAPVLSEEIARTDLATLALVDPSGTARYVDAPDLYLGDRDYVRAALTGQPAISDMLISRVTAEPVVMLSVPVNRQDEVVGALIARLQGTDIVEILADVKVGEQGYAYMINQEGTVVSHPDIDYVQDQFNPLTLSDPDGELTTLSTAFAEMTTEEEGFSSYYRPDGVFAYVGYHQVPETPWQVAVTTSVDQALANLYNARDWIIFLSAPVLLISLLVMFAQAEALAAPLNSLSQALMKITRLDLTSSSVEKDPVRPRSTLVVEEALKTARDIESDVSEIDNIKTSFAEMVQEIDSSYNQLEAYNEEITRLNEELSYLAEHDPLTELPNRRTFKQELATELEQGNSGAVLLFDLDNFKEINDTKGHVFGDKVLQEVGRRLDDLKNGRLFVSRYGGDEFLLLARSVAASKIGYYLDQIRRAIGQPLIIEDDVVHLDFSLGVAFYPYDAREVDQLITYADTAMYQAKKNKKGHSLFFQDYMKADLESKKKIREILRQGLKEDEFQLVYQPEIDLTTGRAGVFEALLRLEEHDISPSVFIPIAEEDNLIVEVGRWVTREVIEQLVQWRCNWHELKPVAINFSVGQLNDEGYVDYLQGLLQANDLSPELIEIEITESILLENTAESISFLQQLKDIGVKLVLDDFGTGYSSISYLSYLPVDKIKLDRVLLDRYLQADNLVSLKNLIAFFTSMDLEVVTEGIEKREEYDLLKTCSCNYLQGYLFSRPLEAPDLDEAFYKDYLNL